MSMNSTTVHSVVTIIYVTNVSVKKIYTRHSLMRDKLTFVCFLLCYENNELDGQKCMQFK